MEILKKEGIQKVGSAANIIIIFGEFVFSINIGDCRSVLS